MAFQQEARMIVTPHSRLRAARLYRGMTQAELAVKLGVETADIRRWELRGAKPRAATIKRLALALGVDYRYLVGDTDDPFMLAGFPMEAA